MISIEPICAKHGHNMIQSGENPKLQDQENVITKALGVMSENGLYAMCIFLLSCNKAVYGKKILTQDIYALWKELEIIDSTVQNNNIEILDATRQITANLPKLILTRKVTEQALVFARYHAKAAVPAMREGERA
jgi:hypothetical protein